MKNTITMMAILLIVGISYAQDSEKRIKFNKGTLKICTSSNMKIRGYDGDEVIIKNLNKNKNDQWLYNYGINGVIEKDELINLSGQANLVDSVSQNTYRYFINNGSKKKLEEGLKPLGNKSTDPADNLYLDIEEKSGELIIRDYKPKSGKINTFAYHTGSNYELLIPNTLKLLWNVEDCQKTKKNTIFLSSSGNPWQLSDFKGEVEISSSYSSVTLTDVTGPVLVNTISGNIKVIFDKESPNNLYSLISNDGYIDVALPQNANINVDAIGKRILSDIDFKVLNETIINGTKGMELQLNSGKTKMKLDAGSGSVYLRKK